MPQKLKRNSCKRNRLKRNRRKRSRRKCADYQNLIVRTLAHYQTCTLSDLHRLRHRVPPSRTPVHFLCRCVSTSSLSTVTPCVERSPPPTCTTLPHTSCRSTGGESPSRCRNDDALSCGTTRRCCGEGVVVCRVRSGVLVLGRRVTREDSASTREDSDSSFCDTVYALGVVEGACFLAAARR